MQPYGKFDEYSKDNHTITMKHYNKCNYFIYILLNLSLNVHLAALMLKSKRNFEITGLSPNAPCIVCLSTTHAAVWKRANLPFTCQCILASLTEQTERPPTFARGSCSFQHLLTHIITPNCAQEPESTALKIKLGCRSWAFGFFSSMNSFFPCINAHVIMDS